MRAAAGSSGRVLSQVKLCFWPPETEQLDRAGGPGCRLGSASGSFLWGLGLVVAVALTALVAPALASYGAGKSQGLPKEEEPSQQHSKATGRGNQQSLAHSPAVQMGRQAQRGRALAQAHTAVPGAPSCAWSRSHMAFGGGPGEVLTETDILPD